MSDWARDRFVAPEISKFTGADIRDMSQVDAEQEHWLANFILNSLFRASVGPPVRQQMFNFLRKSHLAFTAYAAARRSTMEFLEDRDRSLKYIEAIGHWEEYLGHAWQAYKSLGRGKVRFFEPGDGSLLQRLNALHSRAKHAEAAIERGDFLEDSPLCVWLTNEGLRSTNASLTFEEAADVLEELARRASAVQDPATMRQKIQGDEAASPSS